MIDRLPIEEQLTAALAVHSSPVRDVMLQVLATRDDGERARRIGELHADDRTRSLAEVLIDLEEEPAARAIVVGVLREMSRRHE